MLRVIWKTWGRPSLKTNNVFVIWWWTHENHNQMTYRCRFLNSKTQNCTWLSFQTSGFSKCIRLYFLGVGCSTLNLNTRVQNALLYTHTHTHAHTQREREREKHKYMYIHKKTSILLKWFFGLSVIPKYYFLQEIMIFLNCKPYYSFSSFLTIFYG